MGKCGAKELNYLSDVDVIFIADHPADAADGPPRRRAAMLATATHWPRG